MRFDRVVRLIHVTQIGIFHFGKQRQRGVGGVGNLRGVEAGRNAIARLKRLRRRQRHAETIKGVGQQRDRFRAEYRRRHSVNLDGNRCRRNCQRARVMYPGFQNAGGGNAQRGETALLCRCGVRCLRPAGHPFLQESRIGEQRANILIDRDGAVHRSLRRDAELQAGQQQAVVGVGVGQASLPRAVEIRTNFGNPDQQRPVKCGAGIGLRNANARNRDKWPRREMGRDRRRRRR